MSKRDYYEVLGVQRDADAEQIKKSYRKLALKFHPDRNPNDKEAEESFKEASEAYQILSNQESRAKYDRFGHAAFSGGGGFESYDFNSFAEDIFGDIFSSFFGTGPGGGRGQTRVRTGRDLRYQMEITLEEAAKGAEKKIKLGRPVPCESCSGTGSRGGAAPESCRQCGGAGQIRVQRGFFAISQTCPVCRGKGTMIVDPCPGCGGAGQATKEAELSVRIPAGIDSGQRLKLRGEGEIISDGPPGDLYVEIHIKEHGFFRRQDTEIICELPVTFSQAVLGGETEVPTLNGAVTLKIPPGTPSGKVFRLRGKGVVDMHTGRHGDQHVRIYVHVPKSVSDKERALLEELAKIEGKPTANGSKSIFDKVRDFF